MARPASFPAVLTVEEFAKGFKLSPEAVRNLIRKGEIPAIRIGKQYRIPQAVIDRYFAQALPPGRAGIRDVKAEARLERGVRQRPPKTGPPRPGRLPERPGRA